MQINQKLYDKYGNVLTVKSVLGNKYTGILMECNWFSTEHGLKKSAPTATSVSFTDKDMGVIYFFEKKDIGNRRILLNPNGLYAKNRSNIEAQFKDYMESMKSSLPYGTIMFGEDKQVIINSFFDAAERKKEKEFIDSHPMCFARMDLDSNYRVGHEAKYFDEHFHDILYITKGQYRKIGKVQIVNWRSEIATMYYSKNMLEYRSPYYLDVFDSTRGTGTPGIEYYYSLMLRREFTKNPYATRDSYVCGSPKSMSPATQEEMEKIDEIQELYKEGGIDPFLLQVIEEKRGENKLTDIITTIQANQNAMIRHTSKKNMIVQGCAGSGKTMILLHRISYLKYNNYLRNFKRAVIIVPNTNFSIFIDELSGNLEIDQIPRYTMAQYYLELIKQYQKKIYHDANAMSNELLPLISNIADKDFVKTNLSSPDDVFNEGLEYDICEYYDREYTDLLSTIAPKVIEKTYLSMGYTTSEAKTDAERLNALKHYVEVIFAEIDNKTLREKGVVDEARKYVTFLQTPNRHINSLVKTVRDFLKENEVTTDVSVKSVLAEFQKENDVENMLSELREKEAELEIQSRSEVRGFLRFNHNGDVAKKKLEEVRTQIEELEAQLVEIQKNTENELPENIIKLENMIQEFMAWKSSAKKIPDDISELLEEYNDLIDKLYKEDISFKELNNEFKTWLKKIEESTSMIRAQDDVKQKVIAYESAKDEIVPSEDRSIIENSEKVLSQRVSFVLQIYEKYFNISLNDTNSSKQLFVLLALYLLHVGKIKLECDFFFVDEAQDYSDIEYRLLKGILDEKTIFEVYGDCMQRITSNRGLNDWEQMKILLGDEYYELKENYRNTVEIAEYVNEHIKDVFRTIGLHGEPVKQRESDWIKNVIDEVKTNPRKRIAIICKDNNRKNQLVLPDELAKHCYTVLEAKGLEFEAVYVVDDEMTDNEKYISYSRALSTLNLIQTK